MAHGVDLADEFSAAFGTWDDGLSDDEDRRSSDANNEADDAQSSGEDVEGEEKLVGKRRRWAPQKGLVVELSTAALVTLSKESSKFFEGPGTIRHVSLEGSEVRVEWDAQPGVHVAYPTGYMDRYHLRLYAPPPPQPADAVEIRQPVAPRPKRQARASHHELEEARHQRKQDREKQRRLTMRSGEKANR